jgi:hypothetical protein
VLSVLDQEAFAAARDTWPKSWTWNNADIYLEHIQQLAEGIDSQGGRPYYAFIEPAEYVQWCRQTGHQIDSSETRALYAHQVLGEAIPYAPDLSLWALGVVNIAERSERMKDISDSDLEAASAGVAGIIDDPLIAWIISTPGQYKQVVTAGRFVDHDEMEMWGHFHTALSSEATLTFCDEYLSINRLIKSETSSVAIPECGLIDPFEVVLCLGVNGHGLYGVVHRANGTSTLRVWELAGGAVTAVPVQELQTQLGATDPDWLRYGWPAQPEIPSGYPPRTRI